MNLIKRHPVIFWILIFLLVFIIINKISKFFLDQTKFEKNYRQHLVEKVYGRENKEDYLRVLEEQSYPLKYKPFIEFTEQERIGKFVTVSEVGNRCNKNNISECSGPLGGINEIWLFGGSTSFGYGVKNNETIPAYLEKFFEDKKRIINFGSGYLYSTQERIYFLNLLTYLEPPYAAVFIDGSNEFANLSLPSESAISNSIRDNLNKKSNDLFFEWLKTRITRLNFYRLIKQVFSDEEKNKETFKVANEKKIVQLIKRLNENHKINEAVGSLYGVKVLNVLQPHPIYEYDPAITKMPEQFLNLNEEILNNNKLAYEILSREENFKKNLQSYLDLKNFKIDEAMYVDTWHYTPAFNKAIAKEIFTYFSKFVN